MGIEPTRPAWKAGTLPLSYTRIFSELISAPLYNRLSALLQHRLLEVIGAEDEIRTRDIRLGKATLYH